MWTKTPPIEPGHYWVFDPVNNEPTVACLDRGIWWTEFDRVEEGTCPEIMVEDGVLFWPEEIQPPAKPEKVSP